MTTDNPQPEVETDPSNTQPDIETNSETPAVAGDDDPQPDVEGSDPETFPRAYVQQLREENARYRQRAGRADEAARRLLEATVRSAVRDHLADPSDLLTFVDETELVDGDGWPDPDRITAAAESLAASKPHLAPRRPRGDIGQGAAPSGDTVNLAAIMRSRAS